MPRPLLYFILACFCYCCFVAPVKAQTISVGAVTGSITACVGSASQSPNIQQFTVNGTSLTADVTATATVSFEIALSPNGPYNGIATLTQVAGIANGVIYVRSKAGSITGGVAGYINLTSAGAAPQSAGVNSTIKPIPTANPIPNQPAVNSGTATTAINFSGTANAYQWTNDSPGIGLPASGNGNIPSFTALNTGSAPVTAKITVTPVPATYAYVVNTSDHSLSVINTESGTVEKTISINNNPEKTIVSPDGKRLYVKYFNGSVITVVDALTYATIANIPIGRGSVDMEMTPDGSQVYVINNLPAGISVVNTALNTATTIPLLATPKLFALSPDGKYLYVAYLGNGDITVINTASNSIEATLKGNGSPNFMLLSPDGKKIYEIVSGSVFIVDIQTNTVTNIPAAGDKALSLSLTPDGSKMYVVNQYVNTIGVINTVDNTAVASIAVGTYAVSAVSGKNDGYLYSVNFGAHSVSLISTATNAVVKELQLSGSLYTISISPDGRYLYVPDQASDNVWVINTATQTAVSIKSGGQNPAISNSAIVESSGCSGAPVSFTITVNPQTAKITVTDAPIARTTTYGTASTTSNFTVSGSGLSAPVVVTPPVGFEVSTDNVNFSPTVTLAGSGGSLAATVVYIRLTKLTNAGTYSGNIVLTSTGATPVNVAMPNSVVNPAPIEIDFRVNKIYGDALDDLTVRYDTPGFTFDDRGAFKNGNSFESLKITFSNDIKPIVAKAGYYPAALITSNLTGRNGYLPGNYTVTYNFGDVQILPAAIVIKANNVTKPYGSALAQVASSTDFTVTGMKNSETIGAVKITYGAGAAATDAAGVYPTSVVASVANGGTFDPANYTITYQPGTLTVAELPPPVLTSVGTPSAVNTIYGTPSAAISFTISGSNIASSVTVTAPAGFEVSMDNVNFSAGIIIGTGATMSSRPIYIRLAALTNVGTYSGNIILSSGATKISVPMPASVVSKALLGLTIATETKTYGTELTTVTSSSKFIIVTGSLKNGNTISSVNIIYGAGSHAADLANIYAGSIQISDVTGDRGFLASNYDLKYATGTLFVVPAKLTIKANPVTKTYGSAITGSGAGSTAFTATGLQNGQTVNSITVTYGSGTTNTVPAGKYAGSITASAPVGTFSAGSYTIAYEAGDLTVTQATLTVTVANAIKEFGADNPTFTFTYSGFVNNETASVITKAPTVSTSAVQRSAPGTYPIKASDAQAANYTFVYVDGVLTITPPPKIIPPNAFTPNGDGINDTWSIPALTGYKNCVVNIYNRFGQQVYNSVGYATAWDGRYKGTDVPTGTYYYVIDTKSAVQFISGNITVIR